MKNDIQNQIQWILQEKYSGRLTAAAKRDIERLKKGEPVDYVIGFTDFLGCKIDLSKKPLIPRVETEFWVERAIEEIKNPPSLRLRKGRHLRCLDMFSGSGCIGTAILKHLSNSNVIFADNNKKFLEQIRINVKINRKHISNSRELWHSSNTDRYAILQSDIFNRVKGKYDYIFANPPYIAKTRKNKIQKSVLEYEPKQALFGGKDGLFYVRRFLAQAKNFLKPGGKIYMEFDSLQKKQIEKIIIHQNFSKKNLSGQEKYGYKTWKFHKDQYGKWRYVMILRI